MRKRAFLGILVALALGFAGGGSSPASQDRKTCCEKRLLCCARRLACCQTHASQQYSCCLTGNECCNRYPSLCCKPKVK